MKTILAKDLNALLTHDDQGRVLLVDVRECDEVDEEPLLPLRTPHYANLPLSVLLVLPDAEVRMRFEELSRRAGLRLGQARIVLSCRSGGRSGRAQMICSGVGIETENLEGGYLAWQKAKENEAAR